MVVALSSTESIPLMVTLALLVKTPLAACDTSVTSVIRVRTTFCPPLVFSFAIPFGVKVQVRLPVHE